MPQPKRQFKFRLWDKLRMDWADPHRWYLINSEDGKIYTDLSFDRSNPEELTDYIICQYTGMNDINGVEIYEGDIIELVFANQTVGFGRYIVGFDRASFIFTVIEKNWFHRHCIKANILSDYNICRVIGNRFENPDLLRKDTK